MSKTQPPPLMPIFRSQAQGEILTQVMLSDEQLTISDLARSLNLPFPTVQREVGRLVTAGILDDRRVGRARQLAANTDSPAYRPLRDLIMVAFGPRHVVADEFSRLDGLVELYIFGSWAARYQGEPGPPPQDIDVLVVGDVDRDDAFEAAEKAGRRLGREVNPTVVSAARWATAEQPFLAELRRRPLVTLVAVEAAG